MNDLSISMFEEKRWKTNKYDGNQERKNAENSWVRSDQNRTIDMIRDFNIRVINIAREIHCTDFKWKNHSEVELSVVFLFLFIFFS